MRLITLFILVLLVLAGCSRQDENVLKVAMGLTEEEWRVMRSDVFPPFEKEHNCKIDAYQVEAADWIKKLEAMASAGNIKVDVFSQDNMRLYPLVKDGLAEDLTAYAGLIPSEIPPEMREVGTFNGRTYFFPYRPNVQIVYYNEIKFEEYGLKPPATWGELLDVARAFKEKEGIGRIGMKLWGGAPTSAQAYEMIVSAGGDPMAFNDSGCVETFTFLQKLYPYLSPDSRKAKWDTTNTYLANGSFYLAQNWPFGINIIVKDYGRREIKAYHGWAGPVKEAHTVGGEVLGIPRGAPNKDLAIKFMLYMESEEVQETLVSKLGWPSVRTDTYGNVEEWQKPYYDAVEEALKHGVYRPNVLYWAEFDQLLNEAVTRIVINNEPAGPALDEYHLKMKKVIDAYRSEGLH